jgi:hypothetical protein
MPEMTDAGGSDLHLESGRGHETANPSWVAGFSLTSRIAGATSQKANQ